MCLLIKADPPPYTSGDNMGPMAWTKGRRTSPRLRGPLPPAPWPYSQLCCCSRGPTGCRSYTKLTLGMLKGNARGTNGTPRKGRPICATRCLHCRGHISNVCPILGMSRVPVVWEQGAGSRNSAVAPVWYRQSPSTNIPTSASQGGSDGLQKSPCTGTWAPKASFSDLCRAASSLPVSVHPDEHH